MSEKKGEKERGKGGGGGGRRDRGGGEGIGGEWGGGGAAEGQVETRWDGVDEGKGSGGREEGVFPVADSPCHCHLSQQPAERSTCQTHTASLFTSCPPCGQCASWGQKQGAVDRRPDTTHGRQT